MAYSTQADITEQLPLDDLISLSDDAGIGEVDASVVSRAIADADARIDAYCQNRYTLPLDPVPSMIRLISVDLAIGNLFARRSLDLPEVRKDRQKEAIRALEQVAAGKLSLGAVTPAPVSTGNDVSISSQTRIFDRTTMAGF